MNKEPLGLYILRFVFGLGVFAFMLMLYWSTQILETDFKLLQTTSEEIKDELFELRSSLDHMRGDLEYPSNRTLNIPNNPPENKLSSDQKSSNVFSNRPQIDESLPNLLTDDQFYTVTLPEMLGKNFKPKGVIHIDIVGKPENLHPLSNWSNVAAWVSQCNIPLSRHEFGKYETMAPDMAIKIEERKQKDSNSTEFWVHLRDGVYWAPLNPSHFPPHFTLAPHFLHKHQVTAYDFQFLLDAIMNPHVQVAGAVASRTSLSGIENIEVVDDLTMIVRWKTEDVMEDGEKKTRVKYVAKLFTGSLRPLARFVYQYFPNGKKIVEEDSDPDTYRKNSLWAQNFTQHWARDIIVSCGPWLFDGMTERQIRFKRNPNHYAPLAVLIDESEINFKNTPDAAWQDFKAGKIDTYTILPNQLMELEEFLQSEQYQKQVKSGIVNGFVSKTPLKDKEVSKHLEIKRLDFLSRIYSFIGWNENTPFFNSKKVRQAMTMAIDRRRIIQQNLNGMGVEVTGPFYKFSKNTNPLITPWPFDPQTARRYLEEEGWFDSDGDGIIDKMIDGKRVPFRFSLNYYVKNVTSKAICEYVATALKEIGVSCNLAGVDTADLSAAFDDKSFDALYLAWVLGTPPEEPRQLWYSAGAKEKGSSNAIGFDNKEIDALINKLDFEDDPNKRIALYHRFDEIIHEEAPYTFLYTPQTTFLHRDYVQNVFIPAERQDLVPGANIAEPDSSVYWLLQ